MRARMDDGGLGGSGMGGGGKASEINSEESCRSVAASLSPLCTLLISSPFVPRRHIFSFILKKKICMSFK